MRILYALTKTEIGGAQTHVYELLKHAVMQGYEVGLIADKREGWLFEKALELNISFFENPSFKNSFNPFNLFASYKKIQTIVSGFRPDIVHVHSGAAGFMVRLAVKNKVPTIFTAHGWSFTEGVPFLRRVIAKISEKYIARYTSKIICVSHNDYNLALRSKIIAPHKLFQIYNSVPLPLHTQPKQEKETTTIFFIGRLAPPKDLHILFEAFARLPMTTQEKANIQIVGDGVLFDDFQKTSQSLGIEERVFWFGRQNYESSRIFFEKADIFVLPTHWEGFPMTIVEAMSYGLPVIASNVGGISEIVREDNGYLVDSKNQIEDFSKALFHLIEDKEKRQAMGSHARLLVKYSFSLRDFLDRTFALYASE
jgi:glycosyltransferase involved in cell wall biosynthesis